MFYVEVYIFFLKCQACSPEEVDIPPTRRSRRKSKGTLRQKILHKPSRLSCAMRMGNLSLVFSVPRQISPIFGNVPQWKMQFEVLELNYHTKELDMVTICDKCCPLTHATTKYHCKVGDRVVEEGMSRELLHRHDRLKTKPQFSTLSRPAKCPAFACMNGTIAS